MSGMQNTSWGGMPTVATCIWVECQLQVQIEIKPHCTSYDESQWSVPN